MSRIFGEVLQIGYVVRDIEQSMDHWASVLGIGPWYYLPHLEIQDWRYLDNPCEADISLALAQSGPVQVELIQQHNDAPSVYHGVLRAGHAGVQHHLGYGTMTFAYDMQRHEQRYTVLQSGVTGTRGGFAYLATDNHAGTIVEVIDLAKGRLQFFLAIRDAARRWDGSIPVRTTLPLQGHAEPHGT